MMTRRKTPQPSPQPRLPDAWRSWARTSLRGLGDIKHMLSQTRHHDCDSGPGYRASAVSPPSSPKVADGGPSLGSAYSDRDAWASPWLLHPATRCEAMLQWPEKHAAIQYLHFEAASRSPSPADQDKATTLAGIDENLCFPVSEIHCPHIPSQSDCGQGGTIVVRKRCSRNGLQWNAPSCLVVRCKPLTTPSSRRLH
ncbi:hypothetical protein HDV63DRAFT_133564 [Trichoderma sp. SZMC 28014]